jgi:hypothetical protein
MATSIEAGRKIELGTPKGVSISGDIGHFLDEERELTLSEIEERLKETRWAPLVEITAEVLQDYIDGELIIRDEETGKYSMTGLGYLCFHGSQW